MYMWRYWPITEQFVDESQVQHNFLLSTNRSFVGRYHHNHIITMSWCYNHKLGEHNSYMYIYMHVHACMYNVYYYITFLIKGNLVEMLDAYHYLRTSEKLNYSRNLGTGKFLTLAKRRKMLLRHSKFIWRGYNEHLHCWLIIPPNPWANSILRTIPFSTASHYMIYKVTSLTYFLSFHLKLMNHLLRTSRKYFMFI